MAGSKKPVSVAKLKALLGAGKIGFADARVVETAAKGYEGLVFCSNDPDPKNWYYKNAATGTRAEWAS